MLACSTPGSAAFPEPAVEFAALLRIVPAEAGVGLEEKVPVGLQAGVNRGGLGGATDEQRGGREEREREGDLRHHERMPREEAPAATHGVLAGVLLEIEEHIAPGELERRPEREHQGAEHAEAERGAEQRRVRAGGKHQVERHQAAERADQQVGGPEREDEPSPAAEERQREALHEQLADNAPAAAAEREANGDLLAARGAPGKQHVGEVEAGDQQHDAGHAEQERAEG